MGGAAPGDHGGGGVRGAARRHQPLDDGGELGQTHEDDQGALCSGQPVQLVGGTVLGVGGDHAEAAAQPPVGDGNAGLTGDGDGGGDAGHHLKGDARPQEGLDLLAPPAEDKGVAPLEADHSAARSGQLHQFLGDVLLGGGVAAQPLAHIEFLRLGRDGVQQLRGDQVVIDHRAAGFQQLVAAQGDPVGGTAPGPHQIDPAGFLCHGISS